MTTVSTFTLVCLPCEKLVEKKTGHIFVLCWWCVRIYTCISLLRYIHWQYILDCLLIKYQYTMSCKHYKLKFVMSERSNVSENLKSCGYISAIPDSPKIPKFDRLLFRNFLNWNLLNIKLGKHLKRILHVLHVLYIVPVCCLLKCIKHVTTGYVLIILYRVPENINCIYTCTCI